MDEIDKSKLEEDKKFQEHKEDVQKEFKGFFQSLKEYIPQLLSIRRDTDKEATAKTIRDGVSIKGQTAWILVFSILIASIGLNTSSTAVVIGAMLISPLMGPILGIGFSIGVNDVDTLKSSVINFGSMVFLSLLTSFLFFSIPIFDQETPEILARTKPDVRDVLIAMSGGLALIIAISRNKPQFNTVAGVAIATALMPPLCTAGFGLATGKFSYFFGAMFLFTINSIYIALAAFVITKYLKFPMLKYINQAKRKRISRIASLIAFVILGFSIFLFYQLYVLNDYTIKVERFVNNLNTTEKNYSVTMDSINFKENKVYIHIIGHESNEAEQNRWEEELQELTGSNTDLFVKNFGYASGESDEELKELFQNNSRILMARDEAIKEKELEINELTNDINRLTRDNQRFRANEDRFNGDIIKEIEINYTDLKEIRYAREYASNFKKLDTVNVVTVRWKGGLSNREKKQQQKKLRDWLQARLNLTNIEVRELK